MKQIHNSSFPDEPCWCLHCERAYKFGEFKVIEGQELDDGSPMQFCPYEDCDGSTMLDAWAWSDIKEHHPEYPDRPQRNKFYPLYDYPDGHEMAYKPEEKSEGDGLL